MTDSSFDSSAESSDADSDASEKASESGDKSGGSSSIPSGEDEEEEDDEEGANGKRKRPGFKAWALKQVAVAKQQDELIAIDQDDTTTIHAISTPIPLNYKPRQDPELIGLSGPLGAVLKIPETALATHLQSTTSSSKDVSTQRSKNRVAVSRTEDIIASRMMLPVLSEEQSIVETILLNPVVVICGETGSGKTTQIPQFLFEAGFGSPGTGTLPFLVSTSPENQTCSTIYFVDNPGMIGITQPRRVAAMSMASRVASELSLPPSRVSYQIRYDATVSPATSIKFMTDGVLLRELSADFLLSKYSVIIVDEAHERSINTDILIGVLSRVLKLREELWKKKDGNIKVLFSTHD